MLEPTGHVQSCETNAGGYIHRSHRHCYACPLPTEFRESSGHSPSTRDFSKSITAYVLQAMHAGVIRDIEQQRVKKERQADFEMQRALEEEYRKVQQVHDGEGGPEKARGKG